ncbi:uncharacterized protein LY89DRAFT_680102 [Mollisia scopiformis]|uniref:Uncharacterized protein n=1 Tax=Mollisia scopiformis TaxID=149040 RepID=A0A194XTF7_MOLSC|nr:uncharacterized protein LY89DRAFT_680102 [Mollisia scopiformis]KUJ23334.1 hypothetical protein LY89DRAFT_680102 [Mollisia scopiformis]
MHVTIFHASNQHQSNSCIHPSHHIIFSFSLSIQPPHLLTTQFPSPNLQSPHQKNPPLLNPSIPTPPSTHVIHPHHHSQPTQRLSCS